jgi:hypothetical protein
MLSWLVASAFAGQLYINGVFVDPATIPGVEMKNVSISFDAQGNIKVDAPGYKIEVQGNPTPPPGSPGATTTTTSPGATSTPPAPPTAPAGTPAVVPARRWMVTEDNGSVGHTIDVLINGQVVRTVGSGMAQQILDVGKWLRLGANDVKIRSNSVNAAGGTFYVYIGTGSDQSGTVVMENPMVQFGVSSTRQGEYDRAFTLNVDR